MEKNKLLLKYISEPEISILLLKHRMWWILLPPLCKIHYFRSASFQQMRWDNSWLFCNAQPLIIKKQQPFFGDELLDGAGVRCRYRELHTNEHTHTLTHRAITSATVAPVTAAGGNLSKRSVLANTAEQVAVSVSLMRERPQLSLSRPPLSSTTHMSRRCGPRLI